MGKASRRKPHAPRSVGANPTESAELRNGTSTMTVVVAVGVLVAVATLSYHNRTGDTLYLNNPARRSTGQFSADTVDENPDLLPDPLEVLREKFNVTMLSEDPPIYQFDDFLSAKECAGLIKLGRKELEPSTTSLNRDTDNARTSSTGWLIKPYHERNNIIKNVEQRMAEVMNVPRENQEGFQTLEYKPGQYYRTHHDFIIEQDDWASGVRLATFYLYLNDVEEGVCDAIKQFLMVPKDRLHIPSTPNSFKWYTQGSCFSVSPCAMYTFDKVPHPYVNMIQGGGTHFDKLGITGVPKAGRAILWYNVLKNKATGKWEEDSRLTHEAQPVVKGLKWGANKWVHVKDWVTPYKSGRTY